MFFARVIAFAITRGSRKSSDSSDVGSPFLYSILVFVFEVVFMILGSIVIATYSRFREFRADAGGARLASREKMIAALKALEATINIHDPKMEQPAVQALKISSSQGFLRFFASHPPLEERIARLEHEG
jgi:heat shock protein HtpX